MESGNSVRTLDHCLTERESEVLDMIADGMTNKEIAQHLRVSHQTVRHNVSAMMRKIGVGTRTEAAIRVWRGRVAGLEMEVATLKERGDGAQGS